MQRREFLEAVVATSFFPKVNETGSSGRWELDRVEGNGDRIVFLRYDSMGGVDADCIIGGELGKWRVRTSIWGQIKRISEVHVDRAEALDYAFEWMAEN